jgi:glycine cleavage system H protein
MKKVEELILPEDVKYTKNHEWAKQKDQTCVIGITDFAQDQLGDIVYVELPEVGSSFEQNEVVSTVESVKAVAEVYMPISGEIVAVNNTLNDNPGLVNSDPYGQAWIAKVSATDPAQMDGLLDKGAYVQLVKGE